jgi:large subunit ribosomal protein L31
MKKDIHPENYRLVVFKDMSNEHSFIGKSTTVTEETIAWEDGNEYPLIKLEISNMSHPFFTGKMQFIDTAGRIDKFRSKYGKWDKKKDAAPAEEPAKEEPVVEAAPVAEETPAVETPETPTDEAPASDENASGDAAGEEKSE